MRDDVTREEAKIVRYGLLQHVNDMQVFIQDKYTVADMFAVMAAPAESFSVILALMILTLVFFMMTVSFSQKVRELSWEQGVLRSIGLTQAESVKIFTYEAAAIVVSSFISGIVAGIFTILLISALYSSLTELPLSLNIPYHSIAIILFVCSAASYMAVRVPATQLNKHQISSVIKGTC